MEDEKSKFLAEFKRRIYEPTYYYFQEENMLSSLVFQHALKTDQKYLLEFFREQRPRWDLKLGRNVGEIRHYDVKELTQNFSENNVIVATKNGRLFRVLISEGDNLASQEVTVKTWDFFYPSDIKYTFYPDKFCNEFDMLTTEEMKAEKTLPHIIGFCCEKFLAVVYDVQTKDSVRLAIPSDTFDWNARMIGAIDIAHLVQSMHKKKIAIGSIDARNIIINKEGNFKLLEIGLHVGEGGSECIWPVRTYFQDGYGVFAPEICSGVFDIKADVFAYGIFLWELVSKRVFGPNELYDVEKRIASAVDAGRKMVDPSFSDVNDKVASEITTLIVNCLSSDPTTRPEIGAVADQLEKLCDYPHRAKKPKKGDHEA